MAYSVANCSSGMLHRADVGIYVSGYAMSKTRQWVAIGELSELHGRGFYEG